MTQAASSLKWPIAILIVFVVSAAGLAAGAMSLKERRAVVVVVAESARELIRAEARLKGVETPSSELSECVTAAFGDRLADAGVLSVETTVQEASCWPARDAEMFVDASLGGCFTSYQSRVTYTSDWEVGGLRVVDGPGSVKLHLGGDSYFFSMKKVGDGYVVGASELLSGKHSVAASCAAMDQVVFELTQSPALPAAAATRLAEQPAEALSPSGVVPEPAELL